MHAVFGISKLSFESDAQASEAAKALIGNLSQAPGFVSGTIARSADGANGRSMIVFETEDAAKAAAANVEASMPPGAPVEIISLEVFEIVATG